MVKRPIVYSGKMVTLVFYAVVIVFATNFVLYLVDFGKTTRAASFFVMEKLGTAPVNVSQNYLNINALSFLNRYARSHIEQSGINLSERLDSIQGQLTKFGNPEGIRIYEISVRRYPFFCSVRFSMWCGMECGGESNRSYLYIFTKWIELHNMREESISLKNTQHDSKLACLLSPSLPLVCRALVHIT